jgi:hypothetical protein
MLVTPLTSLFIPVSGFDPMLTGKLLPNEELP